MTAEAMEAAERDADHEAWLATLGLDEAAARLADAARGARDDAANAATSAGRVALADEDGRFDAPLNAMGDNGVDVTNSAKAADWLLQNLGTGQLSGVFYRVPDVVFAPRIGEDGYVPLTDDDENDDGPAQVRPLTPVQLAARIRHRYRVYKVKLNRGEPVLGEDGREIRSRAMFPRAAAEDALAVPDDVPNLRPLRGVVHVPVLRRDGSLLDRAGYDAATRLLYLPEPGLVIEPVPHQPSAAELRAAVTLVDELIGEFPFVSEHYRANYVGLLLTPLLRAVAPPPYKLGAIGAHQPGSGKTLLANAPRWIHGGVFRSEMPADDAELGKQVTAILSVTTGPVVVFDNVSGVLKSSKLASLLTSDRWDDRPLGVTDFVSRANDRLWLITGNNLSIAGDFPRRVLRVEIDPGRPHPELRIGFRIPDLQAWVSDQRGRLLWALLTLVRAWVAAGRPLPPEHASDGYARWVRTVRGILGAAEVPGTFDDPTTQLDAGEDDDEWGGFLAAAQGAFGARSWTAKELLNQVGFGKLIPQEALPQQLLDKAARGGGVPSLTKSLGMWLRNREGRWAGGRCVRTRGKEHQAALWVVETTTPASVVNSASGDSGDSGDCSQAGSTRETSQLILKTGADGRFCTGNGPRQSPHNPYSPRTPDDTADGAAARSPDQAVAIVDFPALLLLADLAVGGSDWLGTAAT